ncbi:glycine zipper 2TM domain-containing protein [Undibacterium sp. CY18W]|uniref:Glycine zipper 2TM domain-containing protein n=1 Tax=Undibacterium hunanense TaxID=2762292 RepID=A0ABR6ZTG0_9BURK|nr:glycine zipper 2TM domain-containing protein [Undibacterium hunanense]MBC3919127.1 glycine zipper 2TM domain-containing protein [Undibacterium hunanense]
MEQAQTGKQIHPLVAGAACSVILVSLLGAAAITGILPSSHSTTAPAAATVAGADNFNGSSLASNGNGTSGMNTMQPAPQYAAPVSHPKVAQSSHSSQPRTYSNGNSYPAQAPVQPVARASQNSPVGIGIGAVVGGLLGSQVGNGNGRTLATIAGAVGGGYVGNEVAKRNP